VGRSSIFFENYKKYRTFLFQPERSNKKRVLRKSFYFTESIELFLKNLNYYNSILKTHIDTIKLYLTVYNYCYKIIIFLKYFRQLGFSPLLEVSEIY